MHRTRISSRAAWLGTATTVVLGVGSLLATPATATAAPAGFPTLATQPGTALPIPAVPGGPGASVPFTEYRAVNAAHTGTVLSANRAYTQIAAEATGRSAVQLK